MIFSVPIGKYNAQSRTTQTAGRDGVVSRARQPRKYAIELRDKAGSLKQRLEDIATGIRFTWDSDGGCGRLSFDVNGDYLLFTPQADDDVRLFLPTATSGVSELVWRGIIDSGEPTLAAGNQKITLQFVGYADFLRRKIIEDEGGPKIYRAVEVSQIAREIIETFIMPYVDIQIGTIEASNFSPDYIEFKTNVREALRTLADLVGGAEYGIDENLRFFWYNRSDVTAHKFYVGQNVVNHNDKLSFASMKNKIYLEGGKRSSDDVIYKRTGQSSSSIRRYGLHEGIVSNGAIQTPIVGSKYLNGLIRQLGLPSRQSRTTVYSIEERLERTLPIGAVEIIDKDDFQDSNVWGTTGNGGSNILWGTARAGGAGLRWGRVRRNQVDKITYTLNPESGKFNAQLQFGDTINEQKTSSEIKRMELNLDAVRQRSL